jgi:N-acyl-D-amino-acid deacylase
VAGVFDLILSGGRVLDGTGSPDFPADLAVERGRLVAIGDLAGAEAGERIALNGLTVCPGFIDVHCHSDTLPFAAEPHPGKILQGVTTEINGNCGSTQLSSPYYGKQPEGGHR